MFKELLNGEQTLLERIMIDKMATIITEVTAKNDRRWANCSYSRDITERKRINEEFIKCKKRWSHSWCHA
jgi:hypothetical protein